MWPFSGRMWREEPVIAVLPGQTVPGTLDTYSGTWAYVRAWAEEEIERLREKNDKTLDALQTADIRGRIKQMKKLIALPNPKGLLAKDE